MEQDSFLADSHGRRVSDLRISLTDLCNFRCVYCMPPEGLSFMPPSDYLTRAEVVRFVRIAGTLGIRRVRLTGGEPLLRKDILDVVRALKGAGAVEDLSMTTNASLLGPMVGPLKDAGLDRINISLDSLDPARFREITFSDAYSDVLEAVFLALRAGFPVKLNMVVLRGITERDIADYVRMAFDHDLEVRFLEFMPLCGTGWRPDLVWPIGKVRETVLRHYALEPDDRPRLDNTAQVFRLRGGMGKVGFIASLTESFCDDCSRMRLSADGRIHPCLFSNAEVSVKELLRSGAPDESIADAIREAARIKPAGNRFREKPFRFEEDAELAFASNPMIHNIGG